jgi:hypothetical protein
LTRQAARDELAEEGSLTLPRLHSGCLRDGDICKQCRTCSDLCEGSRDIQPRQPSEGTTPCWMTRCIVVCTTMLADLAGCFLFRCKSFAHLSLAAYFFLPSEAIIKKPCQAAREEEAMSRKETKRERRAKEQRERERERERVAFKKEVQKESEQNRKNQKRL